jgi:hypothetical protein
MLKVWIELPPPRDDAEAEAIVAKANRMLARLRKPEDVSSSCEFHWDARRRCYCYGSPMGHVECGDRGEWFSLDYFGREGA